MTKLNWRNDDDYAYTTKLDNAGWAWEFLRRNKDYRSSWRLFQQKTAEYEQTYGPNWRKNRLTFFYDPPRLEDEIPYAWAKRCTDTEPYCNDVYFEVGHANQWGLLSNMYDPDLGYFEQEEPVRFESQIEFPERITDDIQFRSLLSDLSEISADSVPSYRTVEKHLCVLAFNLSEPIDRQLKKAKKVLQRSAKHVEKAKRKRREPKYWQRFLQVLDAKEQGATLTEIGLHFNLSPNETFEINPEANNAKSLLSRANNLVRNYRKILISSSSKK